MIWRDLLPSTDAWNGRLYGRFRLVVGVYLAVHFLHLAPWAPEVFSSRGVLPDGRTSPLLALFPNILAAADGPAFVTAFVAAAGCAALLFAVGAADRLCALYMFYALACLYGRNPLIANPSLPYVGWLLLAHATLPPLPMGIGLWRKDAPDWRLSRPLQTAAWFLLAAGYSFSGYTKLVSPSWLDGTALVRVLESPLARPGLLRDTLLSLPPALLRPMAYGALALELLFLPLALIPRLRPWLWSALLGMHLALIALIDFADLSLGMVTFHLFVADPAWARRWSNGSRQSSTELEALRNQTLSPSEDWTPESP
jgi:hypothetical protein